MELYAHPFSSYCQKVLIALYENATPFEFRMRPATGGSRPSSRRCRRSGNFPFWWTLDARCWSPASSSSISACTIPGRCGWFPRTHALRSMCG